MEDVLEDDMVLTIGSTNRPTFCWFLPFHRDIYHELGVFPLCRYGPFVRTRVHRPLVLWGGLTIESLLTAAMLPDADPPFICLDTFVCIIHSYVQTFTYMNLLVFVYILGGS